MKYLKKLTRSITGILVVVVVVGTPLLMGRICDWLGIIDWLDHLWSPTVSGWVATIVSRAVGIAVWVGSDYLLITRGERYGWFWFEPERPTTYRREKEPSVDKSGDIAAGTVIVFLAFVIFEVLFRLGAWSFPPFAPPPGG